MAGTGAGAVVPPGNDEIWRQINDLSQRVQQLFAIASGGKAIATAVQAGLGSLAGSGTTWAGPVASPSTVSASGAISGGSLSVSTASTSGDLTAGGILRNVNAYSNPITTSFRSLWVTSVDGQFGFNLSSREFKQDIADFAVDPATVLMLRLVTFRYIQAVEIQGEDAEVQVGLIAEEVHDLGLTWLVEYDNGKPCGIKFHLLALALLVVAQDHEARISGLEARA